MSSGSSTTKVAQQLSKILWTVKNTEETVAAVAIFIMIYSCSFANKICSEVSSRSQSRSLLIRLNIALNRFTFIIAKREKPSCVGTTSSRIQATERGQEIVGSTIVTIKVFPKILDAFNRTVPPRKYNCRTGDGLLFLFLLLRLHFFHIPIIYTSIYQFFILYATGFVVIGQTNRL